MSLTKVWYAIRAEAKLPEGIGLHGLRHSIGSTMAWAGAGAPEIMQALGPFATQHRAEIHPLGRQCSAGAFRTGRIGGARRHGGVERRQARRGGRHAEGEGAAMTQPNRIPDEASEAVPLRDAFREHTPADRLERYEKILKYRGKKVSLWSAEPRPSLSLQPQQTPGVRPTRLLYTGKLFVGEDARVSLQKIEAAGLFGKLRRGELAAWGRIGSPIGAWEQPPAEAWAALWIDDLDAGTVKGEGVALFDVRVGEPCAIEVLPVSGAPGRPSSMNIVLDEHKRRRAVGTTEPSRQREGEALAHWLKATHPLAPRLTGTTIRNKLPKDFRPNIR
jgi:hypothetical protein